MGRAFAVAAWFIRPTGWVAWVSWTRLADSAVALLPPAKNRPETAASGLLTADGAVGGAIVTGSALAAGGCIPAMPQVDDGIPNPRDPAPGPDESIASRFTTRSTPGVASAMPTAAASCC